MSIHRKVNLNSPKETYVMKTTIEKIAGRRYRIELDPAASNQEGGKRGNLRSIYQLIPCRYGEIYEYADGNLAWLCSSVRLSNKVTSNLPDWMIVLAEYVDGANFIFPVGRFKNVANWAKPRTRRIMSAKQKAATAERLKSFRFSRTSGPEKGSETGDSSHPILPLP